MMFLCDKDLSRLLGVSTSTITRAVKNPRFRSGVLSDVRPVQVGGARRWRISEVAASLGVTVDDIKNELK